MSLSASNTSVEISTDFPSICFRANSADQKTLSLTLLWRHADNFLLFVFLLIDPVETSLFCKENTSKVNTDNSEGFLYLETPSHCRILESFTLHFYHRKKLKIAKRANKSEIILHPHDKTFYGIIIFKQF